MGLLPNCIVILHKDNERLRIVSKHLISKSEKQRAFVVASKEAVYTSSESAATIEQRG